MAPFFMLERKIQMKKLIINIWAYNHHTTFIVESEDNSESVEKAILDKLGEKSIVWENLGNSYSDRMNRITYEEVIKDDRQPSEGTLHTKESSGSQMGAGAS